ncbi:MAG: SPOR domain-containing protein [Pseudomonadota bacterium]|nr:SPOR domain-containing protein [Pseudomonadota bacterium]
MRTLVAMTISLAAFAAAAAPAQSVRTGVEAWQRGDPAAAVAVWRPLAEKGDADAAFNLGQAYRLGRGVPTNLAAAQIWLLRAAGKDHLDAQVTLGLLLFESGDRDGGLRWLKAGAERGDARALLIYGTALFNGDGVTRDPVLAYAYVSRAAAKGLTAAKVTLTEMDRLIPVAQRRKGVALALRKAKAATPAPRPAAPPKAPLASKTATGGWRIQLGAFSKRASAEALFTRLSQRPQLAGRQMVLVPVGDMVRLQVGPFPTRTAAAAACAALSKSGQGCFPVAAK